MKGKDIEESITLKLIVSPFVGVYVFFVVRGGCALFSVSLISWEQRKFSDLYQKNDERNNGQFGWNKTISTSTMTFNEIGNGAADSSIDNYKVLRIGDIAFEGHTNKEFRYGRFVLNDIGDGIMSPRFATLRPIIKQDFSFWKHYIHNERIMRKKLVRSTKAGTMMNELVIDDLMEQLILVPSHQEQKKIGAFFGGLHHLITLHQSKLFEHNKKKTCQFMISWEQRKLSELVEKYEDPVETPHDGYTRLGIRSHAKGTFHEYVKPGHELETAQMHRVAANRLIFNITFAWEHAVAITDENDAGKLVSHRFPQFTLSDALRPEFLKYVILDEDFHHNLYLSSPGGAGRNRVLKTDEALDYPIYYPSADEQHTIGTFLDKLTDLITLHQRKLSYYRNRSILYGSF